MKKALLLFVLSISMLNTWADDNITFADENVKAICVANWDTDGDGELSMDEAAAVTSIGRVFSGNVEITTFDELQFFTGITEIPRSAFDTTSLQSITIPKNVTKIYEFAFSNCQGLSNVTLNADCIIDSNVFPGCYNIKNVFINGTLLSPPSQAFPDSKDVSVVYGDNGKCVYAEIGMSDDYLNTYESPITKEWLNSSNRQLRIPIEICTKNVEVSQIQFDISFDERGVFSLAEDDNGKKMVEMDKERFDYDPDFGYSHTMTLGDYTAYSFYRVIITNSDNTPILGNDGAIAYVTICVKEDAIEGDYNDEWNKMIKVSNIELSTPTADRYLPVDIVKGAKIYLRDSGNFNGDETVSVTDYAGVVKYIAGQVFDDQGQSLWDLQGVPEWVVKKASDVNEDGEVTVTDVSGIVNIVLYGNYKGNTANAKARRAVKSSGAMLSIEPFNIARGETKEVAVSLSSAYSDLSQCQFDLTLPEGLSVASAGERLAVYPGELTRSADCFSHTVTSALREDGTVRVLCLSGSNEALGGSDGNIVRLNLVADKDMTIGETALELSNVEFAKTDASQLLGMGGVTAITIDNNPTGITSIDGQPAASTAIYSADGIRKDRVSKGLNIMRSSDGSLRKVMVK